MIHVKSFSEAANIVAEEFLNTMTEEGFCTFREMQKCYWWEPADIRDEIQYILESKTDAWMFDDGSHVQMGVDDMQYADFKRLVFNYLRDRGKY